MPLNYLKSSHNRTRSFNDAFENYRKNYNSDNITWEVKMKTDIKSILDLAGKIIEIAKTVLVEEPKPKRKPRPKKEKPK
jgi:small-conductance mechanosensitive channel